MGSVPRVWLLCALLLTAQAALAEKLRLVADAWPPFTELGLPNGGLATDLVRTALARAGYPSEYVQAPWARALRGVGTGDYDVLVNAWFSQERLQLGAFSSPYLTNRIRLLKRRHSPIAFANLTDLQPFDIAVVRNYAYGPAFDSDTRLHKVQVSSFGSAARMLHAGRVSLTLEDEYVARYHLNREPPALRDALEFLPKALSENHLHILVSRHHPAQAQIVAAFNRAIEQMKADGSYRALFERHGL